MIFQRTYDELITLSTFEERLEYLKLDGHVGQDTFGFDRYTNQRFYSSSEWKRVRNEVIVRDKGYDLGVEDEDYLIRGLIMVHHMNPITIDDLRYGSPNVLDPNLLITVSRATHDAITYKGATPKIPKLMERTPYDTCPWRH